MESGVDSPVKVVSMIVLVPSSSATMIFTFFSLFLSCPDAIMNGTVTASRISSKLLEILFMALIIIYLQIKITL